MKKNINIIKEAEKFLDDHKIEYRKPEIIRHLSKTEVEVIFRHPLSDQPDYVICPDEYRVIVNIITHEARWGSQM